MSKDMKLPYFEIGEALIGTGPELAHVDLMIGSKNGPVGQAFATGMTQLSAGHTPLLSVIRPNLPTKPSTLIVPKVTLKKGVDTTKIFGPAQSAVAKAVADAVEEGIIPKEIADDIVIVASVFIAPDAEDFSKIYRFNYGATKLAIKRALEGFPSMDKVLEESNKSTHAIMGFKVSRLFNPPYLQVAFDTTSLDFVLKAVKELPQNDHLLIEAGTPLIKRFGTDVISKIREARPDAFIVADLKTLDTGNLEARMVADAAGDAVVVSALAPVPTIVKAIEEAHKTGIYAIVDTLNLENPVPLIKELVEKGAIPDIVELHRGIDVENNEYAWGSIDDIKKISPKTFIAVAGGVKLDTIPLALKAKADILVVGRAITGSKDIRGTAEQFIARIGNPEIDQFRIMTDF
ncbi:3-keto-L-gulonate-6-phosphate decarboxylase UlaD [Methanimicrococcus sp. At1]|uniref:Bifunctional enzyme Fae/Hps n=1 Tax=Methanimicrococcus hacksteinii TaxID=3028293 RepID=A0ABU3VPP9_9EURY|nr:bifunctional 5,6,7,8-tetrahydromethanopterin hydro-lyase/3-hexulose-6-phosphate synthase [Methanimicrococcus sp. At1]MDV0445394.1 3-keto-L-gulonate-6-phosphate decarboxylase UlaD [Methanimicrococcus sp. At1]